MLVNLLKYFKLVCSPALLMATVSFTPTAYADDTEIYFNEKEAKIKPNVLFILDRSLSMNESSDGKAITNAAVDENSSKDEPLTLSKINLLKESLQLIFTDPSISGFRVGVMDFGSGKPNLAREILDIDEVDHSRDINIVTPSNNGKTTFRQIVWIPTDDGYQHIDTRNPWLTANSHAISRTNHYFAYRFDNILIKNKSDSGASSPNYGIDKVEFNIYLTGLLGTNYRKGLIIYLDPNSESQYLRQRTKNDLVDRVNAAKKAGLVTACNIPASSSGYYTCDITALVRKQIASNDWQDGNAITVLLESNTFYIPNNSPRDTGTAWFKEAYNGTRGAYMDITAQDSAIAVNKRTRKESILDTAFSLETAGSTHINRALLASSQYISNKPKSGSVGPYHVDAGTAYSKGKDVSSTESPLLAGCQLTHFILMSDGQPSSSYASTVRNYMGQKSKCTIDGVAEKYGKATEECGRSFVYWLTQTDQSLDDDANFKGPNYIWTHTIGFGMGGADDDDEQGAGGGLQFDPSSKPFKYLEDLAGYGSGQFHQTKDIDGLVEAFKSIINEALSVNGAAVSGEVVASSKDIFKQRREVFYSLFQSQLLDYWPGNVKGFKMIYQPIVIKEQATEIAVLYSWDKSKKAIGFDGNIKNGIDSAWSAGTGDGGNVKAGGVVAQLPEPAKRNLFTIDNGIQKMISSSASLSPVQLGLTNSEDDLKKGLLDFMRGYTFHLNGSSVPAGKKIGDSILSGVTLVSYGCDLMTADITTCAFDQLNLVGLSAANDGVFRGYDLQSGKAMYEFMPTEMLPLIKKLQKPQQINESIQDPNNANVTLGKTVKSYGLDGKVIVYHEDDNGDDYINNGEKAYAFIASGRGGPYLYAFDISNKIAPKLLWTKTDMDLAGLAQTWSQPVIGKIKIADTIVPVVIFGAGYDEGQSDKITQHTDSKGNAVYMLNAVTGNVIWSTGHNMQYSVPGGVAVLKADRDNDELITDIFFGDMGGQLWRFVVNNGTSSASLVEPGGGDGGIVAKISGTGKNNTRRFYQKPIVYDFEKDDVKDPSVNGMIAVNIGTGYKPHPLVKNNEDRFYSFRLPRKVVTKGEPLTESDLGVLTLNTTGSDNYVKDDESIAKGFMVKLDSSAGEKVISDAYAVIGRLVFNTYVPDNTYNPTNCVPNVGKQRSYNINLVNGRNLLSSPYIETSISTIPNDIALYCGDSSCSIVTGTGMLDGDVNKYDKARDDCNGTECLPFNFPKMMLFVKTGWTDLFSPN